MDGTIFSTSLGSRCIASPRSGAGQHRRIVCNGTSIGDDDADYRADGGGLETRPAEVICRDWRLLRAPTADEAASSRPLSTRAKRQAPAEHAQRCTRDERADYEACMLSQATVPGPRRWPHLGQAVTARAKARGRTRRDSTLTSYPHGQERRSRDEGFQFAGQDDGTGMSTDHECSTGPRAHYPAAVVPSLRGTASRPQCSRARRPTAMGLPCRSACEPHGDSCACARLPDQP